MNDDQKFLAVLFGCMIGIALWLTAVVELAKFLGMPG